MTITTCHKNILIIEDDKDIRESMKDALEIEGYNVIIATNGRDGLASLRALKNTCLVLLDMVMPQMGGREFIDTMKQDKEIASVPVFIHSAIANKDNSTGAIGWIRKPADLEVILATVKNHC
ncbi:MAG: response regulator [Rhizobacter sp.]|nr:response regulator [Bacteriovorax sp.]